MKALDHAPTDCAYENGCSGCCPPGTRPNAWCYTCHHYTVHPDWHAGHELDDREKRS